ncbi:hypothetical protein DSO57_1005510 [Entomophthora muscae]|uniref:Uncharacterized protein n=1 Tax=Entomophthora muscae TaxID=34485 RepID=A0ACC2SWT6_9FUNG|nr:hypothetical protein DSO57_1005510 [Entomophthora muscae]
MNLLLENFLWFSNTEDNFFEHQREEGQIFFTFLQTLFGYCLTGLNKHHYFVFFVGKRSNGKSMFTSMPKSVLNEDDANLSSASVFAPFFHLSAKSSSNSSNAHTTQLNNLVETRIALIDELNSESFFDKFLIKRLTGSDFLLLCFPYDKHEFVVTHLCHLLIVTCNFLPYIVTDLSVTRCFIIIWFNTTFVSKSSLNAEQKAVEKADSLSRNFFYGSR